MRILNRLRLYGILLRLVLNPNRTELIFKAVELTTHEPDNDVLVKDLEEKLLENVEFKKMYDSNYIPDTPKLEMLKSMPEQSFGNLLYHHLADNNLDLDLFPRIPVKRPADYMSLRIYQDHDLWHVLLGCGVSIEDELEVQAFGVAQYHSPLSTLLVAGGLLHLLMREPMRAVAAMKKVVLGYELGSKATFLPNVRLHDMFAMPISEVRQQCLLPA